MGPKVVQSGLGRGPKTNPKNHHFLHQFWAYFGVPKLPVQAPFFHTFSVLGGAWVEDGPRWPQDGPRRPKITPRRPKLGPRWPQDGPRWAQDGPNLAPGPWPQAQDGSRQSPKEAQDGSTKALGEPKGNPRWPKAGPRQPKMGPRWRHENSGAQRHQEPRGLARPKGPV